MLRPCPVCACREKVCLYEQNFHNRTLSLTEKYDVVVCRGCGFAYADSIPGQAACDAYYEAMSKYEFNDKGGAISGSYREHFEKVADFIATHFPHPGTKILDVGCSTGGLLSALRSRGYRDLFGIDPSPVCVRAVKELHHLEAEAGTLFDFRPSQKYDLILLSAVLEHLVDLPGSMEKIHRLLNDQGGLFIEVPDAARFDAYVTAPYQQFSIEHVNYFTKRSLENLLAKNSFKLVEIRPEENRVNPAVDPDIFAIAQKITGGAAKIFRDEEGEQKIKNYITRCSEIEMKAKSFLQRTLFAKDRVIVWGTGTHTQRLLGAGLDTSKVLFFVDSNARYWGKRLNGVAIHPPADIRDVKIPILVSTYACQKEIVRQIREVLNLKNEILEIY